MFALLSLKRLLAGLALFLFLALAMVGQQYRVYERLWFWASEESRAGEWQERSLWLSGYRATIDGQPVEGIDRELSALSYDPDRNTLFSVAGRSPAFLVELSLDGHLLRRIELRGFQDVEAVEYLAPNTYLVTDERRQRLIEVKVAEGATVVDAASGQSLSLGIGLSGNKGFEGLAYDPLGKRLFVAKERDPIRIYEIAGFPHLGGAAAPVNLDVQQDLERDEGLFLRDVSSLHYDVGTGHLMVLSDQSRLLLELNAAGQPVSGLSLLAGQQGLKGSVPQAEGVASDGHGVVYVVSEPNLFYRFEPPAP